jgi:hypothetical protein
MYDWLHQMFILQDEKGVGQTRGCQEKIQGRIYKIREENKLQRVQRNNSASHPYRRRRDGYSGRRPLWFAYTAGFEKANLHEGARVEFEARVKAYSKGYVNSQVGINNRRQDYKLSHPAKINVIKE